MNWYRVQVKLIYRVCLSVCPSVCMYAVAAFMQTYPIILVKGRQRQSMDTNIIRERWSLILQHSVSLTESHSMLIFYTPTWIWSLMAALFMSLTHLMLGPSDAISWSGELVWSYNTISWNYAQKQTLSERTYSYVIIGLLLFSPY